MVQVQWLGRSPGRGNRKLEHCSVCVAGNQPEVLPIYYDCTSGAFALYYLGSAEQYGMRSRVDMFFCQRIDSRCALAIVKNQLSTQ